MATLTLFKSRAPSMGYVFKSGRTIHFANGEFATSNKAEIEELTFECEAGHPCYYIDSEQTQIEAEAMDPLAALKAKIREEERAKIMAAMDRDMGNTVHSGKLEGIANSKTIVGLVSDSISQTGAPTPGVTVSAKATKL